MDYLTVLQIGDRLPLSELWGSDIGFVVMMVVAIACIGLAGRNLAVSAMAAYLVFAFYASTAGHPILEPLLYVTLTLIIIGSIMKVWRLEGFETGS